MRNLIFILVGGNILDCKIFRFRLVDLPPLFYDKCLVNPSYVGSRRQYPPIAIAGSLKSRLIMKFLVDS